MTQLADDELDDLINDGTKPSPKSSTTTPKDDEKPKYSTYYQPTLTPSSSSILRQIPSLLLYLTMSFLLHYPRLAKLTTCILLLSLIYLLLSLTTQGPTQTIGRVRYDFTKIKSQYDFDIGKIDHWCIDHSDDCTCEDPLQPTPKTNRKWFHMHRNYTQAPRNLKQHVDVVFIGQSVVEAMSGKHNQVDLRHDSGEYFGHIEHMFMKRFQDPHDDNHNLYGLAMGSAGDQSNNVLWRLMHGELNDDFDPPFWWIVVGMEDLARFKCSEEIVIMGVLRIVEEIKKVKPDAKIIINGLFPMTMMRTFQPQVVDFVDAERNRGGDRRGRRQLGKDRSRLDRSRADRGRHQEREHKGDHDRRDGHGRPHWGHHGPKPPQKAKEFKQNMKKRTKERLDQLRDANRLDEQNLRQYIKNVRNDKTISDDERSDILRDSRKQLTSMIKDHRKKEQNIMLYLENLQKDTYNPVMKEAHTFHKDNAFHHHHDRQIPVWTAIHEINTKLHDFAKVTSHVTFYDPTPLFTEDSDRGKKILLTDYMSPRGHPTREGFKLWLNDIQHRIIEWKVKAQIKELDMEGQFTGLLNEFYYSDYHEDQEGGEQVDSKIDNGDVSEVDKKTEDVSEVEKKTEDISEKVETKHKSSDNSQDENDDASDDEDDDDEDDDDDESDDGSGDEDDDDDDESEDEDEDDDDNVDDNDDDVDDDSDDERRFI